MSKKKPSFSLISLGCARTLVDSESITNKLQDIGFQWVDEGCQEEVTILNTCSFIQAAIEETESNIDELILRKKAGDIKHLAVVGCYPSRFKKAALELKYPEVDVWLSTQEQGQINEKLSELIFKKKFQPVVKHAYTKFTPSHYSYLKISEGCDNWCSFCTIPKIRGKHKSIPLDEVIELARKQLSFGAKELIVIAEDTTAWGEDIYGKPSFDILLDELAKLPVKWIRPMYIFPSRVNQDLIDVIAKHDNITNYIDVPVQHVSNSILESMNRRHDKKFLENMMDNFVSTIPDIEFRSTFLLGYPGETEEDIKDVISFLNQYPIAQLGCFAFSEERETRSYKLDNKIDSDIIKKRVEQVMDTQYNLIKERNLKKIGKRYDMVYEGNGLGRAEFQAPEVDGQLLISNSDELRLGEFYTVEITGVDNYDLEAKVV
jgi:ribosomal protein S12 methylthiotransferase